MDFTTILGVLAGLAIGSVGGLLVSRSLGGQHLANARKTAEDIIQKASSEGDHLKREMISEVKEELFQMKQGVEVEVKERRVELQRTERRLEQKEENLERKLDKIARREEDLKEKLESADRRLQEADTLKQEQILRLEEVAQLSRDDARDILMKGVEEDAQHSLGMLVKDLEEKARREAARRAREIVVTAVQRCAVESCSDVAVSVVNLPSDEMKGRIIGREGRNIRAFETETGVDLIVDDTPEAVTLSCFDPIRREVARRALERLVTDGRIHPARIEELIQKATVEVEESVVEAGEQCLLDLGIKHMHSELVRLVGTLRYRFSYGQNALKHSMEVAHISGIIAAEVGADEEMARRAGLLHDIGKAVDHKIEGPHAIIGADLTKRYNEPPEIVNAVGSHHEDMEVQTVYDVIVAAADAISAARPGARRESLDAYVKRLEKLESLAQSFKGVSKAYAIQAGREVRVMVAPNLSDEGVIAKLAYDVAKKIEEDMKYPGQIKVTAIKEFRAVEYAK
ncbi:MAG: ribonuclease Y [Dethiosulfovibrio peptidovorans]|nr:MAG: ribonuclease Y [Dethiosulfovibrio peptidovorans]